jgi:hypothetical protein
MSNLKDWYEAYKRTKQEELKISVKVDIDWIWLAFGVIFVMLAYKELFS